LIFRYDLFHCAYNDVAWIDISLLPDGCKIGGKGIPNS
jgi:hypothetical protein